MKTKLLILAGAGAMLAAGSALAHHSGAMFDDQKSVTLQGTIKEFQFTNPHSWIQLYVPDATGKQAEWSLETNGVSQLFKKGWRPQSLKPGDKVTIVAHPLKSGNTGGSVMSVVDANGKKIGAAAGGD